MMTIPELYYQVLQGVCVLSTSMSSSNRVDLFSYAEKASREQHNLEGSDTDYLRQPLGGGLTIEWSLRPSSKQQRQTLRMQHQLAQSLWMWR